jgi:hypothetical protein
MKVGILWLLLALSFSCVHGAVSLKCFSKVKQILDESFDLQSEFSVSSWRNCPGDQPIQISNDLEISASSNKIFFSGSLNISKVVNGPIELTIDVNKCDSDMKKCEKNPTQTFKQVCLKLKDKKSFYYSILSPFEPAFECPLKPQQYTTMNSSIDLTPLTFLPVNGYIWIITGKFIAGHAREIAFCLESNLKIVRTASKRKPK